MGTCIAHSTALAYWLTRSQSPGQLCVANHSLIQSLTTSTADVDRVHTFLIDCGALPDRDTAHHRDTAHCNSHSAYESCKTDHLIHTLVQSRADIRRAQNFQAHAIRGTAQATPQHHLPEGSVLRLNEQDLITSPEATFFEIASGTSNIVQAIEVGYYLCGKFYISPEGYGLIGKRNPLTSIERISNYLDQLTGVYGVAKAREALLYVHENCESPQEVNLSIELALPLRLGGRGFPPHQAAQEFPLHNYRWQRTLGCNYLRADIYFPDLDAIFEYDSYEKHMNRQQFDHTQTRAGILRAQGHKVISVTFGQLLNNQAFNDSIFTWEAELGLPHPSLDNITIQKQYLLHNFLYQMKRRMF